MSSSGPSSSGDVPTVLVKDSEGRDLLCFLEQLIPLDGHDYALLTPVDTPVCLFKLRDGDDPQLIDVLPAVSRSSRLPMWWCRNMTSPWFVQPSPSP